MSRGDDFIGSTVISYLINNTTEVANLYQLTYADNLKSLDSIADPPRYHYFQVYICEGLTLDAIYAESHPISVMHMAAVSHMDHSSDGPSDFIQTNIVGTYS